MKNVVWGIPWALFTNIVIMIYSLHPLEIILPSFSDHHLIN